MQNSTIGQQKKETRFSTKTVRKIQLIAVKVNHNPIHKKNIRHIPKKLIDPNTSSQTIPFQNTLGPNPRSETSELRKQSRNSSPQPGSSKRPNKYTQLYPLEKK